MRRNRFIAFAVIRLALGCLMAPLASVARAEGPPPTVSTVAKVAAALVEPSPASRAIRFHLADRRYEATPDERSAALAFFDGRAGEPLFADPHGLTPRGTALLTELQRADDYGLPASELTPSKLNLDATSFDIEAMAETEVRLTFAALKYARFARGGRIAEPSKQLATYLDRAPQLIAPRTVLEQLSAAPDAGAALRGFNPQHAAFEALRKAYNEARLATPAAANEIGIPDGPSLRPGTRSPAVAVVRKFLKIDVPTPVEGAGGSASQSAGDPTVFDPELVKAVVAFQEANGLEPADGIIGNKTRSALNSLKRPATYTLLANMEEWRWMPADLGSTNITINIPEFTIRMTQDDVAIHTERVVTGLVTNQTPVFSDALQTVVLQPDWVLPESIKINEALPSLLNGGGMFYSSGLRIKKGERGIEPGAVNWSSANLKAYTFYQPPGASNALGQVKFLFPNKHAVYMHDTPAKHLFDSPVRAFSHGCMRVRNPVKLAELVLMHDKGWTSEKVKELLEDGPEDNRIALDHAIPVHVTYFTAVPDENGKIKTFQDIYGHEKRIVQALEGRWGEIDIPPDHLAPMEDREFEVRASAAERRRSIDDERTYAQSKSGDGGGEFERALKGIFGGF